MSVILLALKWIGVAMVACGLALIAAMASLVGVAAARTWRERR